MQPRSGRRNHAQYLRKTVSGRGPAISPLAGKPAPKEMLIDVARLEQEYFERKPDVSDRNQLVSFGTSGHRGSPLHGSFQRSAHPGNHAGHLRLPASARHRWPALHGEGHPCAFRARTAHRARSAGGERRRDHHPGKRRRNSDAGHLASHSGLQPRPQRAPRRWHRHHAVAQSAGGWRLQVQPAQRRPCRHRRNRLGPGPRQRIVARRKRGRQARSVRQGHPGRRPRTRKTSSCLTFAISRTSWTWTRSAAPASNLASIRWAVPRGRTGSRSIRFTDWTSTS